MAYCTNCGAPLKGRYCQRCGAKSDQAPDMAPGAPPPASTGPAGPPAQAPPRQSKALTYVLLGCAGVVVLALVGAIALGLFVRQKAAEMGRDPAMAAVKMAAALTPDIEVVNADEATGRITLRNKKTGKTVTMDVEDVQKGRISFEGEGGERVTIQGEGEGTSGAFRITTPEGEFRAGTAIPRNLPSWIPLCPGAEREQVVVAESEREGLGTLHLTCSGSVEDVAAFYERQLKAAGMAVEKQRVLAGSSNMVTLKAERSGGESLTATILSAEEGTAAHLVYKSR